MRLLWPAVRKMSFAISTPSSSFSVGLYACFSSCTFCFFATSETNSARSMFCSFTLPLIRLSYPYRFRRLSGPNVLSKDSAVSRFIFSTFVGSVMRLMGSAFVRSTTE